MRAAYCAAFDDDRPLAGLVVGERPEPVAPPGWATVRVRAAALNGHDLWSLRGVGLSAGDLPRILGSDAAGVDAGGNAVVVHAVIGSPGAAHAGLIDPTSAPVLSERHDGTLAELVVVPEGNLVPKPEQMSFEEAACLPTAWLTAYRMLFVQSGACPGDTVLVQGASGGVSSALLALGRASAIRMWATSRTESKRALALHLGAESVFEPGQRLPERVDAVMETVGAATWDHSMKALKPGGVLVVAGATAGHLPPTDLRRLFAYQLRVVGSRMGTREELAELIRFCEQGGVRPGPFEAVPLADVEQGFARLAAGDVVGKVVVTL